MLYNAQKRSKQAEKSLIDVECLLYIYKCSANFTKSNEKPTAILKHPMGNQCSTQYTK